MRENNRRFKEMRVHLYHRTDDFEFNKTDIDHRGNTKYSTIIVKLCKVQLEISVPGIVTS